jgi:hypothetical protein
LTWNLPTVPIGIYRRGKRDKIQDILDCFVLVNIRKYAGLNAHYFIRMLSQLLLCSIEIGKNYQTLFFVIENIESWTENHEELRKCNQRNL